ncbi:MAG: hypothetical protein QOF25_3163 [Mycobacterium sp.]|nr:hypothetical protein [Mycobacterium sp.]
MIRGHYLTPVALFGISVFPLIAVAALHLVSLGRTSLRAASRDGNLQRSRILWPSTVRVVRTAASTGGELGGMMFLMEYREAAGWDGLTIFRLDTRTRVLHRCHR